MKFWELDEPGYEIAQYFMDLNEHADEVTAMAITAIAFRKTPEEIFEAITRKIINESKK